MNRRKILPRLCLSALLVAALVFALLTQWRFQAVALKLRGELPTFSWRQIAYQFTSGDHQSSGESHRGRLARVVKQGGEDPCPLLWSTPLGEIWGNADDQPALELAAREQLIERIYHNSTVAVETGDVVIDVGGHLGTFTRFSLDRGARVVIVLEPEPRNIACFKRTFAAGLGRGEVVLIEAAAWHSTGVLRFSGEGLIGHVDGEGEMEVRAVTLDDIVAELALDRVDFIKMDIEGAELDALTGARQTIADFGPEMAISIYHRPGHEREIPHLVLAARPGYRLDATEEFAYFR